MRRSVLKFNNNNNKKKSITFVMGNLPDVHQCTMNHLLFSMYMDIKSPSR